MCIWRMSRWSTGPDIKDRCVIFIFCLLRSTKEQPFHQHGSIRGPYVSIKSFQILNLSERNEDALSQLIARWLDTGKSPNPVQDRIISAAAHSQLGLEVS